MMTSTKSIHSLILDSGPIIKNSSSISTLLRQAESLYTVPSVIEEIKDSATRARLESLLLPFLVVRAPQSTSVNLIQDFARKTGDLEVLSRTDIQLIALAYELECERNHGNWRLRSVPGQKKLNGRPPLSLSKIKHHIKPTRSDSVPLESEIESEDEVINETVNLREITKISDSGGPKGLLMVQETLENISLTDNESQNRSDDNSTPVKEDEKIKLTIPDPNFEKIPETMFEAVDEEGWITPSNLRYIQVNAGRNDTLSKEIVKVMQVALLTTDYAMQNVLLCMNLNVLSPSFQRISSLKTRVLRCHACFKLTKDMTKQFCWCCGQPTLIRTTCSTDKNGDFRLHLKKNMQWNSRGNVYSIPKPKAGNSSGKPAVKGGKGEWGRALILAEDQKEYLQILAKDRRKKERDLMDEDFLPGLLSGERRRTVGRPMIGAGKNINSRKKK